MTRRSEFANLEGCPAGLSDSHVLFEIEAYDKSTFSRTKLTLSRFRSRTCTEGSMKAWFEFNFARLR